MNRRAILTALVAQLKTVAPFKAVSCRGRMPGEINEQPALQVIYDAGAVSARIARGGPAKVTINVDVWIFDKNKDLDEEFGFTMLDHIDALDKFFAPNVFGQPNTLGGLVDEVRIEGDIIFDAGHVSGQALAKIPLQILVPT